MSATAYRTANEGQMLQGTCPGIPITRQKFASAWSQGPGSRGVSGHARLNFASALTSKWAYG